jgi:uncharacterized protein (DUF362 family)
MGYDVAIRGGKDPYKTTGNALKLLDVRNVVSRGDKICIKPNLVNDKHPNTGITTHPEVVEAIVDWIGHRTADISIVETDTHITQTTADQKFRKCGYFDVFSKKKMRLVNLTKDRQVSIELKESLAHKKYEFGKTIIDADIIINVPTLKQSNVLGVTLGFKNLYGLLSGNKTVLGHRNVFDIIDRKTLRIDHWYINILMDLYTIFEPKLKLTVIDGIIGSDGYWGGVISHPMNSNVICAGYDTFSVDCIGAELMGLNRRKLAYLRKAEEAGFGSFGNKINLLGDHVSRLERKYDLGFDKAIAVMDAILDGYLTFKSILEILDLDETELRYLLEGLAQFQYIDFKNDNIRTKPKFYLNYLYAKTAFT